MDTSTSRFILFFFSFFFTFATVFETSECLTNFTLPINKNFTNTNRIVESDPLYKHMVIDLSVARQSCKLAPRDKEVHDKILQMLMRNAKLIEYNISLANYTVNPLRTNITWSYKPNKWARISTQHGQTLLSLAFNYGILSLMTLSFGVELLDITLVDSPSGCFGHASEVEKVDLIIDLLLRDFKETNHYLGGEDAICHQIIMDSNGYAKFTDRCCRRKIHTDTQVVCESDIQNIWLTVLDILLKVVKMGIILFGPLMMPDGLSTNALDAFRYVVKLKEPLYKTMWVSTDGLTDIKARRTLDLRLAPKFKECMKLMKNIPKGEIIKIKLTTFRILVQYKRLLTENRVPVGVMKGLTRSICYCKIKNVGPCQACCAANLFGKYRQDNPVPWINFWKLIGRILLILLLPLPLYIRLFIYYKAEETEVLDRKGATIELNLRESYDFRLLHYLTPLHGVFVFTYVIYFATFFIIGFLESAENDRGKFQRVLIGSFRDLKNVSWVSTLAFMVGMFLWPFKKFGILGPLIGLLYWPIAMPICLLICCFYCLPLIYLTFRMFLHSRNAIPRNYIDEDDEPQFSAGCKGRVEKFLNEFEVEKQLDAISPDIERDDMEEEELDDDMTPNTRCARMRKLIVHTIASAMCILTMYAIVINVAECAGFLVEVCIFTLMGIIVNAGTVLRYVSLIILVVIYSYDCYNNVYKKYLKLNKSLFNTVKGSIKDVEEVTRLPSYLQENRGFKAQEASDQAEHESIDDIHEIMPLHFDINDLILFIDNEDMPRIPRKLFEDVCQIRVAGSPGPVWRSLIEATKNFLVIVVFLGFVFLVVVSFGAVYRISSTNQMMATLAGGFMPFLMRHLFRPTTPDVELGTVSFKSKLDEIIENFHQPWPMFDFHFEVPDEDEWDRQGKEEEEKDGSDDEEAAEKKKDENENKQEDAKNTSSGPAKPFSFKERNNGVTPEKVAQVLEMEGISVIDGKQDDDVQKVKFILPEQENQFDVDILVYLPQGQTRRWLKEWSEVNSLVDPDDSFTEKSSLRTSVTSEDCV